MHVNKSMSLAFTIGCDSVVVVAEPFQWVTLAKLGLETASRILWGKIAGLDEGG